MSGQMNIGVPRHMSASGVAVQPGGEIYTIICTAAASVTITEGVASGGATLVDAFAMTDGGYVILNMRFPAGAYITLTGTITISVG